MFQIPTLLSAFVETSGPVSCENTVKDNKQQSLSQTEQVVFLFKESLLQGGTQVIS